MINQSFLSINFHIDSSGKEPTFELTTERSSCVKFSPRYRVLRFHCNNNYVNIFLTTEQAKEIAGTILAQLESEREVKVG